MTPSSPAQTSLATVERCISGLEKTWGLFGSAGEVTDLGWRAVEGLELERGLAEKNIPRWRVGVALQGRVLGGPG